MGKHFSSWVLCFFISYTGIATPALACIISFSGDNFLKVSQQKGLPLVSDCYRADRVNNVFYAFPAKACMIKIQSNQWLRAGWSFTDMRGKGRFVVSRDDQQITIKIEEGGGFKVESVTLSSESANCDEASLASVLR